MKISSFFQQRSASNALKIIAVLLITLTGILFGQGLFTASTVSSSAQQREEVINARIVTNFYSRSGGSAPQYHTNEITEPQN
jgi:F0F1-type ATP synthase membrane subunit c/vacuolar-type H+-ATPase subunit K